MDLATEHARARTCWARFWLGFVARTLERDDWSDQVTRAWETHWVQGRVL